MPAPQSTRRPHAAAPVKRAPNKLLALRTRDGAPPEIDYKDVALLRQFISDRGKIRPRRVTGLTPQQQRRMATAIRNAREMALLPITSR